MKKPLFALLLFSSFALAHAGKVQNLDGSDGPIAPTQTLRQIKPHPPTDKANAANARKAMALGYLPPVRVNSRPK